MDFPETDWDKLLQEEVDWAIAQKKNLLIYDSEFMVALNQAPKHSGT